MTLDECLPAELRGPATTITRIAVGLSGAGVYRVHAAGRSFVLKIVADGEPHDGWRRRVAIQQRAGDAGLAPRVVHVDEARRAVVSDFVVDRSFAALYVDPRTRQRAVGLLGRTLRRVHALPLAPDVEAKDPRDALAAAWSALAGFAVPGFVADAVRDVLAAAPPAARAAVLSHNDVNPSNLAFDGERLVLLDWDVAGANEPDYDLAAIALFLRMDDATCRALLEAYDGAPAAALPARFAYDRRLVAALCGATALAIARRSGHPGGDLARAAAPSLSDVYRGLREGTLGLAGADGQWQFGLALAKACNDG